MSFLSIPEIDSMPNFPALSLPDFHQLNEDFTKALLNPNNHILRHSENGHPIFGAYVDSPSNEMVTWGILAIGEWIMARDYAWIAPTFTDFFSKDFGLFMNAPNSKRSEHWYLFYVNSLAGAVMRALFPNDSHIRSMISRSADTMKRLAERLNYDFNQQGYSFDKDEPFTYKDIYRQPDSIAGYSYNMLFASIWTDKSDYINESIRAMRLYEAFNINPWYEIPNGSAGLLAAVYLDAHNFCSFDCKKIASWVFDHTHGPLQIGKWGDEEIDGLMMGWRGDTRKDAMCTAYSMETLMPLQFILPAVRYMPSLADAVAKYVRCALANFTLFYAIGTKPLYETCPNSDHSIPYERLDRCRDGHTPAACGDFYGQRSVYGAGYLYWVEALMRKTTDENIIALDLSLTDWLAAERMPVYLLRNPYCEEKSIAFSLAPIWQKLQPSLYSQGSLTAYCVNLFNCADAFICHDTVQITLPSKAVMIVAILPNKNELSHNGSFIMYNKTELIRCFS